jgi:hypothetical protein
LYPRPRPSEISRDFVRSLDRMTTAEESGTSDVMAYQYDPLSRRTNLNFRAGVMTSAYTYTDAGDLTALNLTTTTGVIPNYTLVPSENLIRPGFAVTDRIGR